MSNDHLGTTTTLTNPRIGVAFGRFGTALDPTERRYARYLDALEAFGLRTCMSMEVADPPSDPPADPPKDPAPADPPKDLGFPKDTPLAEMTVEQREAYWKHQARKHESTWKGLVGDRRPDDVKNDLAEYERLRQEQLTPAEKALTEAEQRGRQAAQAESSSKAARAILRANLQAQGIKDTDEDPALTDLVDSIDVTRFIADGDVDTDKLATFAKRFATAGTATTERRRDFGAGPRRDGDKPRGAGGKAEAERRYGKRDKANTGA